MPSLANLMATASGAIPDLLPPNGWVPPIDWTTKVAPNAWPMLMNDRIGCCTIAAVGHAIHALTSHSRAIPLLMTDAEVVAAYSAVSGYNPADPSTDRGAVMMDVLEYWMQHGFIVGGELHKIAGFASLNPLNPTELKFAIQRFGFVYLGVELPVSAQTQNNTFEVTDWSLQGNAARGSWGGHCLTAPRFDENVVGTVSWGNPLGLDWQFHQTYTSEVFVVYDAQDELIDGLNRDGFNTQQLLMDLDRLRQGIPVG